MPSDRDIAQAAALKPVVQVAEEMGIAQQELDLYGSYKAKVRLELLERLHSQPLGKYILVTAMTPTPFGEGKTVVTIGLGQALIRAGRRAIVCLREPSMAPVFGIKGGATGGGQTQIVPKEDINLHFTGDLHATTAATNLLAAMVDASLWHGNRLDLDPQSIACRRVVDCSDVALRNIITGLGGVRGGVPRETGFDMSAASEVHAALALCSSLDDLRARLGRMLAGYTPEGQPVTAEDLKAAGAMTVLLKDAIKPNLVQTLEGGPCFVHCGPFGNIAHGSSSVLADQMALRLGEYVITEAGFGADCGAEKFCNIKCRQSGLQPDAAVLVASVRALKMHGGAYEIRPGRKLPEEEIAKENPEAVAAGSGNLAKQIENLKLFGLPVVVAVNRFPTDHASELEVAQARALELGAERACLFEGYEKGGEGAVELAEAVMEAVQQPSDFRLLYDEEATIRDKIETIATQVYGADGVDYRPAAEEKVADYEAHGWGKLPMCMAKTQYSLSHDPQLRNRPTGFIVPVLDIRAALGAGFLYPLLGQIMTMPALPTYPAAHGIDIDEQGRTVGLV